MSSKFVDLSAQNPETQVGQASFFNRQPVTPAKPKADLKLPNPGGSVGGSGCACGH